jgi:chemotaxis protein methyltransferase CheR
MAPSLLAGAGRGVRESSSQIGTLDLAALSRACGIALHAYRPEHVADCVARSVAREPAESPAALAALMRGCSRARDRFRRAVAISVTGRFRDPHQFDLLREQILPGLLAEPGEVRVWSAGCATGLEVFGVATLLDAMGELDRSRLIGSDLLERNIQVARSGGDDGILASSAVMSRTRWEVRDLLHDGAPAGRFDLILCRNVGIYFAPDARTRLIDTLAGALRPGGVLLLGRSERLTAPEPHGLEPCAPNAYRRLS